MLNRRRVMQAGFATLGSLSVAAPLPLRAQGKPAVKVRYNEVVRSIMYAPAYVAMAKGFFKEAGLDITLSTAQGGDKSVAALLSGAADIALIGPETTIYVQNSTSPTKIPMFCGMTTTDGFLIMSREKIEKFDWSMLKGKDFLGFRPGSTPLLYLEEALRKNGIDPQKDLKLNNNVTVPARVGSWLAGQNQFAIFTEPDASQLEMDGKAHFVASVGQIVGPADYTTFMATDKYIKENPEVIQTWTNTIYRAQKWTAEQAPDEIAKTIAPFFTGVNPKALEGAAKRFNALGIWKKTPKIEKGPIERFQDILVNGHVLDKDKRVPFEKLVLTQFADKAK
jgi:NitT/TauT family transport system substrate-binding protein